MMKSNVGTSTIAADLGQWTGVALISIGIMYVAFAGMKSWAADLSSDQRVERTQLQLEYLADITFKAASKTGREKVNLIHIVRLPDFTDKYFAGLDQKSLSKIAWVEDRLTNEWGGKVGVYGVNGKLTIEYEGVPDAVCENKLFDYARKAYEFKCNGISHQTKIVGAIDHQTPPATTYF